MEYSLAKTMCEFLCAEFHAWRYHADDGFALANVSISNANPFVRLPFRLREDPRCNQAQGGETGSTLANRFASVSNSLARLR